MRVLILTREAKSPDRFAPDPAGYPYYFPAWSLLSWLDYWHRHDVSITIESPDEIDFASYDLVISYFYPHILRESHINAPRYGIINAHVSYLPYNRGANPNVHSIIDLQNTLCGATIHKVDTGIDTGNILAQKTIEVSPLDTGETLYHRLEQCCFDLLVDYWPVLESLLESTGELPPGIPQDESLATTHRKRDLETIDDLESQFGYDTAHRFVDILRARTFPPYRGAYVRDANGRKVHLRLQLEYDDETS